MLVEANENGLTGLLLRHHGTGSRDLTATAIMEPISPIDQSPETPMLTTPGHHG